jgi:hypothetical protein
MVINLKTATDRFDDSARRVSTGDENHSVIAENRAGRQDWIVFSYDLILQDSTSLRLIDSQMRFSLRPSEPRTVKGLN